MRGRRHIVGQSIQFSTKWIFTGVRRIGLLLETRKFLIVIWSQVVFEVAEKYIRLLIKIDRACPLVLLCDYRGVECFAAGLSMPIVR